MAMLLKNHGLSLAKEIAGSAKIVLNGPIGCSWYINGSPEMATSRGPSTLALFCRRTTLSPDWERISPGSASIAATGLKIGSSAPTRFIPSENPAVKIQARQTMVRTANLTGEVLPGRIT